MQTTALVFANGSVRDGEFVQRALHELDAPLIIAADGGARVAAHFNLTPDVVLGDMDSLSPEELASLRERGVPIEQYPPEKDETDLEIALKWAVQHGIKTIRVVGALGRRIDQTFGNIYLLALPALSETDTRFVSVDQQLWLARPGSHVVEGQPGDTVSLIPIKADVANIHTDGLYYPLNGEALQFGPARGVSNVLDAPCATITFEAGLLLIVHTIGRAE